MVRQEQAAVEVADFSEQGANVVTAGGFWFSEAFKEQRVEEDRIEFIRAKFLAAEIELVSQVIDVPVVEEEFFLEKPDEHEAVHQHGGIPAALVFVLDAENEFGELQALDVELAVKLFGDALDIKGFLQSARDFGEGDVALRVEFADVNDHRGEFADEQVAGLAPDIEMVARVRLAGLAFDPIPKTLRTRGVGEYEEVFVAVLRVILPHADEILRAKDERFE